MRKLKFLLILGLFLGGLNGYAANRQLDFSFHVDSSGADFFVCAAGLKHPDTDFETGGGTDFEGAFGDYDQDWFEADVYDWQTEASEGHKSKIAGKGGTDGFNTIGGWPLPNNLGAGKEIKNLKFHLGSDTYGAYYFVKLCYVPSWIDYDPGTDADDHGQGVFHFAGSANYVSNTYGNAEGTYSSAAGLKSKVNLYCEKSDYNDNTPYAFLNAGMSNSLTAEHIIDVNSDRPGICYAVFTFWESNANVLRGNEHLWEKVQIWAQIAEDYDTTGDRGGNDAFDPVP